MIILDYLSLSTGVVGVSVIVCGALLSVLSFVRLELKHVRGESVCRRMEKLRHHFGSYILLGLEFLIAADIMDTIMDPSLQEIGKLGSIVAIRTVLSFFLNREFALHTCETPNQK